MIRAQRAEQTAALGVTVAEQWQLARAERVLEFWRAEVARLRTEFREGLAAGQLVDISEVSA